MNIIGMIVDRDCHVGMTNKKVIRHVISRLKNKESTFWEMTKEDRRYFMLTCIKEHEQNQKLYRQVMSQV